MQNEYWHHRWKKNEIEFDQKEPNVHLIKYINILNLKPHSTLFVPLCGKSIDMLWLSKQQYKIIGNELDYSASCAFFEENQFLFKENNTPHFKVLSTHNITILSGDFFRLNKEILGSIDAIYDRAALIALPLEMRKEYAKKIIDLSNPGNQMFLITGSYDQNIMKGPPFSVDEMEVNSLYSKYFHIEEIYTKITEEVPAHLQAKGLKETKEHVFHLTRMDNL